MFIANRHLGEAVFSSNRGKVQVFKGRFTLEMSNMPNITTYVFTANLFDFYFKFIFT